MQALYVKHCMSVEKSIYSTFMVCPINTEKQVATESDMLHGE